MEARHGTLGPLDFYDDPPATPEEWAALQAKKVQERRDNWRETLLACGVPERYSLVPAETEIPAKLSKWPEKRELWSYVLLGPPGTGKTWYAVRLLGEIACTKSWQLGRDLFFIDARRALEEMKAAFGTGDDDKTLRKLLSCRLLVLDDIPLGKGPGKRASEWAVERYSLILMERHSNLLQTIITANATDLAAFDSIDPRVTSRLHEGIVKSFPGADRRRARKPIRI